MTSTLTLEIDESGIPPGLVAEIEQRRRRALGPLLAPVRTRLIAACVVQALAAVVVLAPFVAVALLGRELLGDGPVDEGRVWWLAWVAVGAVLVRVILMMAAGGISHLADNALQLDLRRRLVDKLGRVPLGWFGDRTGGQVKKAVVDDVGAMHHLVAHAATNLVAAVVTPLAAVAYMFSVDWRFTLVVMTPVVVGMALYSRQMSGYSEKIENYNQSLSEVNGAAVEFVQGIAVVKAFGQAGRAHRRFLDTATRFVDFFWDWVRGLLRVATAAEVVLAPLAGLLVVTVGGTLFVQRGWIDAVDLLPFFLVGLAVAAPVLAIGYSVNDLQAASTAAQRVAALLDVPELVVTSAPRTPDGTRVVYDGVRFSYDDDHEVLSGTDLVLEPGTITALVGPSGSGKSTIAKLLCRFWDPTDGAVTLGGVDLRDIAPEVLYRQVGFVFQDVQLLHASVRDNIALARPGATDDEVESVARAAQIHDRIVASPRGYDSVVGDDARLSGGEAQRVSIARALLAGTPIVVLDEATAYADPESEAAIQDALSVLVAGRTLLVIAHRLGTVVGADQIAVVDDGRIVETGRHDDLLASGGLYARLWASHDRVASRSHHPPGADEAIVLDEEDTS